MKSGSQRYAPRYALGPIAGIQAMELFTGIGLTLLGSALPALAARWALDDARSGQLLLAVFAGSAVGALLMRPPFHRVLAAGMALIALSMAALAAGSGHFLFLMFVLFGVGLGMAMTANSLLTGQRYRERRAAMLTVLNFSWSAGAAISPFAIQFVLRRGGVPALFWSMTAAAVLSVLVALAVRDRPHTAPGEDAERPAATSQATTMPAAAGVRTIAFFSIFGLLYCGSEAALGGWVLTYVHRLGFRTAAAPPLAASCFWLSLLIGRAVAPAVLLRMREERLLAVALISAFVGVAALLTLHSLPAVMFAAALAGFSLAPVFPICVSIFLALARDASQARWMFAVAGVGSATLPWATGQMAARTGSLHTGLLVPLAGVGVMLAMLRWPGGGTDMFRRMFPPASSPSVPPVGPAAIPAP